jgi:hypothetical protein
MGGVFIGVWSGGLKVREHWKDLSVGGRITLKLDLKETRINGWLL